MVRYTFDIKNGRIVANVYENGEKVFLGGNARIEEEFKNILNKTKTTKMSFSMGNAYFVTLEDCKIVINNYRELEDRYKYIEKLIKNSKNNFKGKVKRFASGAISAVLVGSIGATILKSSFSKGELEAVSSSDNYITSTDINEEPIQNIPNKINNNPLLHDFDSVYDINEDIPVYVDATNLDIQDGSKDIIKYKKQHKVEWAKIYVYSKAYGVDPNLMMALFYQESRGVHRKGINKGGAIGIGQIQWKPHKNSTVSGYNFITKKVDKVKLTLDNLNNIDKNIQVSIILFRKNLEKYNGNISMALQAYNFGKGGFREALKPYFKDNDTDMETLLNEPWNLDWVPYMKMYKEGKYGDPYYVKHVLRYLATQDIYFLRKDNTITLCTINAKNKVYD